VVEDGCTGHSEQDARAEPALPLSGVGRNPRHRGGGTRHEGSAFRQGSVWGISCRRLDQPNPEKGTSDSGGHREFPSPHGVSTAPPGGRDDIVEIRVIEVA
jgi:hypothetical protein